MNDPDTVIDINIRSQQYLSCALAHRRHCNEPTNLFALALPPGHVTLDVDEAAEDPRPPEAWILSAHPALLFHVEFLMASVEARLARLSLFRIGRRNCVATPAWANHCEACGAWLNDDELFCEPGGGFRPTSEAGAVAIRLLRVPARP